jgi:hypothetical protein
LIIFASMCGVVKTISNSHAVRTDDSKQEREKDILVSSSNSQRKMAWLREHLLVFSQSPSGAMNLLGDEWHAELLRHVKAFLYYDERDAFELFCRETQNNGFFVRNADWLCSQNKTPKYTPNLKEGLPCCMGTTITGHTCSLSECSPFRHNISSIVAEILTSKIHVLNNGASFSVNPHQALIHSSRRFTRSVSSSSHTVKIDLTVNVPLQSARGFGYEPTRPSTIPALHVYALLHAMETLAVDMLWLKPVTGKPSYSKGIHWLEARRVDTFTCASTPPGDVDSRSDLGASDTVDSVHSVDTVMPDGHIERCFASHKLDGREVGAFRRRAVKLVITWLNSNTFTLSEEEQCIWYHALVFLLHRHRVLFNYDLCHGSLVYKAFYLAGLLLPQYSRGNKLLTTSTMETLVVKFDTIYFHDLFVGNGPIPGGAMSPCPTRTNKGQLLKYSGQMYCTPLEYGKTIEARVALYRPKEALSTKRRRKKKTDLESTCKKRARMPASGTLLSDIERDLPKGGLVASAPRKKRKKNLSNITCSNAVQSLPTIKV